MAITRTGVVISTNPTFGDSDDRDFYINGGQLGINQVPVSGLTPDTVYYAKGYVQQDGVTITDPSYTAFRTRSIGETFYFKNENTGYNTMTLFTRGTPASTDLEYTLDGLTWTPFDLTQQYNAVSVPQGGSIYMRSSTGFSADQYNYMSIYGSAPFSVGGNIAALIDYTDTGSITDLSGGEFEYMFMNSNNLISAADIDWCNITAVTGLGIREMFLNATSLAYPPNMDNFVEISGRYGAQRLFDNTAITRPPTFANLATVGDYSMSYMFDSTPITSIPQQMFPSISSVGTNGIEGLFYHCTSLTSIPSDLFSYGTEYGSLYEMFQGCTGLTSIPAGLFRGTDPTKTYFSSTFAFCTGITSIPADLLPNSTTSPYCYTMFNGCTSLRAIPQGLLPATNLSQYCYYEMFKGCTSLVDVPADLLPATTLAQYCYNGMFKGCTSITDSPTLPASDINFNSCYNDMFSGCTSLKKIVVYANYWVPNNTSSWVYNVSSSGGDFYNLGGATNIPNNSNGIPSGWTEHTSI